MCIERKIASDAKWFGRGMEEQFNLPLPLKISALTSFPIFHPAYVKLFTLKCRGE